VKKQSLKLTRDTLARLQPSDQIYWFGGVHENLGVYVGRRMVWRVRLNILQPTGSTVRKVGTLGLVEHLSIEQAVAKKKEAELAALQGLDLTDKKTKIEIGQAPTLSFMLDLYISTANIKPATATRYRSAKGHIDAHIGSKLVTQITRGDILTLKDAMDRQNRGTEAKGIRNTFNKARDLMCAAYNFFGLRGTLHAGRVLVPEGFNPARLVKRWTNKEMGRKKSDPYSAEEAQALIEAAKRYLDPEARATFPNQAHIPGTSTVACVLALLFSGCRKEEMMGASKYLPQGDEPERWSGWVDRPARVIRLVHTKTGPRDVFIPEQLDAIFQYMWGRDEFWVFPGRTAGGRVSKLERAWNRIHREAGVRRRNIHQTRHTLVHHMLDRGEGLGPAGGAVGHGSIYMTETYAYIAVSSAQRAHKIGADAIHSLAGWDFLRGSPAKDTAA